MLVASNSGRVKLCFSALGDASVNRGSVHFDMVRI